MGNFAQVGVDGTFSLIYIVYNTFFALRTQEDQVLCFRNAAGHLDTGGYFVLEAFIPDPTSFVRGQSIEARSVTPDQLALKVSQHDPVRQHIMSQHIVISADGAVRMFPVEVRYAWPAELDLMARLAGLRLNYRWNDWSRGGFQSTSKKHVSVYQLTE
jgi:hypothetical protein